MRGVTGELLKAFIVLTLAYLVLIHFTGFATDVGALGTLSGGLLKTAQGR
jgi:hypothetical protein